MANIQGFVVDAPKCLIKTKKGNLIIDRATAGSVDFSGDSISINGGWSMLALAEIPKSTKIEVKISNAILDLSQLALQSGGTISTGAQNYTKFGDIYAVTSTNTIVINEAIVPKSLLIDGMTEVTTEPVVTKTFKVTIAGEVSTVQLFSDVDPETELNPIYEVVSPASLVALSVKTTDVPSSGSVIMTFPIFESEEVESSIFAYGQLTIFKAKISQTNKIGGAYKAHTPTDINLSGLDAHRSDGKAWDFKFLPVV